MSLVGDDYDAFNHLRRSFFWEVDRPVVMLTLYADDSGKKDDSDYTVVAGFIGLVAQWEEFSINWRLQLAAAGFHEFHASDFFYGAGIFADWKKPEHKSDRDKLLGNLAQIINDHSLQGFSCIVHTPGWQRVNEDYMLEETGFAPFPWGGRTIVERVRKWCLIHGHDANRVEYFFDGGSDNWGHLAQRLKIDLAISAHDGDSCKLRPLQAADWLAYEEFRQTSRNDLDTSLLQMLKRQPDRIFFSETFIYKMCAEMHIPVRSEQGKVAVRMNYGLRKTRRLLRGNTRLTKILETFWTDRPLDADIVFGEMLNADPNIQLNLDSLDRKIDSYYQRSDGLLKAMSEDSREDQSELLRDYAQIMQVLVELQEERFTIVGHLVERLKTRIVSF